MARNDELVPIQQSEAFVQRLQELGVPHRLLRVPSVGHGFNNGWEKSMPGELPANLDWFNQHLLGEGCPLAIDFAASVGFVCQASVEYYPLMAARNDRLLLDDWSQSGTDTTFADRRAASQARRQSNDSKGLELTLN